MKREIYYKLIINLFILDTSSCELNRKFSNRLEIRIAQAIAYNLSEIYDKPFTRTFPM